MKSPRSLSFPIINVLFLVFVSMVESSAPPIILVPKFSEGLGIVKIEGKYGYIDKSGTIVIQPKYFWADDFSDGLALVSTEEHCTFNSRSGEPCFFKFIDKSGREVIGGAYDIDFANSFSEGLSNVKIDNKWVYINKNGTIAIRTNYTHASPFSEGYAIVTSQEKTRTFTKEGFIDKEGVLVIPLKFEGATYFSEGLAAVLKEGKWGYINRSGEMVIESQFDHASQFSEGLAPVWLDGIGGCYIDKKGEVVFDQCFSVARRFYEGFAAVGYEEQNTKNRKYGFIDKSGNLAIEPKYEYVEGFSEGMAAVKFNGKWGFIDRSGALIINPRFTQVGQYSEGIAAVRTDMEFEKWGYIDKTGEYLWKPTN